MCGLYTYTRICLSTNIFQIIFAINCATLKIFISPISSLFVKCCSALSVPVIGNVGVVAAATLPLLLLFHKLRASMYCGCCR